MVFAYGQSGSGKTYTMEGAFNQIAPVGGTSQLRNLAGVIPLCELRGVCSPETLQWLPEELEPSGAPGALSPPLWQMEKAENGAGLGQ